MIVTPVTLHVNGLRHMTIHTLAARTLRLMKGMRGNIAAWWALVGLAITTFAFLGVNMFLSGLHSYGTL